MTYVSKTDGRLRAQGVGCCLIHLNLLTLIAASERVNTTEMSTMKNQQNYPVFFTLSPHLLDYSLVQSLIVLYGQGFPNVPNDSIHLFPRTLLSRS